MSGSGGAGAGGASGGTGGGAGGSGGAAGSGGADASAGAGGSAGADAAVMGWPGCLEPVFSGVMKEEFCEVYGRICTFVGTSHYTSMADCLAKFRGGSNDGDACKSGHLCRAATMPSMKVMDCATAGTAQCRN
jgi:hypothetical protein